MKDPTIEEINKIRAAMGVKLLPVPGQSDEPSGLAFKDSKDEDDSDDEPASTLETREAAGYENWQKLQQDAEAKKKRDAQKDAIRKARERAQRLAHLEGKSLGEAEGDDLDTKAWLLGKKKREKKIEKERQARLQQELLEREQLAAIEYTAKDLAGIKVGHELDRFDESGEQILTLKDTAVDDEEEDDELENLDLRDKEKLQERLDLKKNKPAYNPNDIDDFAGEKKSILAQYDEEIEGKKRRTRFTLDGQGSTAEAAASKAANDALGRPKGIYINLDELTHDQALSDAEKKPKKEKKKKKKSSKSKEKKIRKKDDDDDDIFPIAQAKDDSPAHDEDGMDVDEAKPDIQILNRKKRTAKSTFLDDDEMQAMLASQRRAELKKRKKVTAADLARQLREEEESAMDGVQESIEGPDEEPGLVVDETTEFVSNLQKPEDREARRRARSSQPPAGDAPSPEVADEDVEMQQSYAEVQEAMERSERDTRSVSEAPDMTTTGLDEESNIDQGIGATLAMLKQRNLIENDARANLNEQYVRQQKFLYEKHKREDDAEKKARSQREKDRNSGRLNFMSSREQQEYARQNNTVREQYEARQMADVFNKEYKPDVHLKYVDDFGREMNAKEAFKHLSHQFHGKGSGKQKTEKRLKKIEDEKRREAMSSLDSSQHTGMNTALSEQSKKKRQAGVRLQ